VLSAAAAVSTCTRDVAQFHHKHTAAHTNSSELAALSHPSAHPMQQLRLLLLFLLVCVCVAERARSSASTLPKYSLSWIPGTLLTSSACAWACCMTRCARTQMLLLLPHTWCRAAAWGVHSTRCWLSISRSTSCICSPTHRTRYELCMPCYMLMCQQAVKDAGSCLFPGTFAFRHAAAQHAYGCVHVEEGRASVQSTTVVQECAGMLTHVPAPSPSLTPLTTHELAASPSRPHLAVHAPCRNYPAPSGGPPGPEVVPASVPGPHPA
jgi:hypothetical protein